MRKWLLKWLLKRTSYDDAFYDDFLFCQSEDSVNYYIVHPEKKIIIDEDTILKLALVIRDMCSKRETIKQYLQLLQKID